MLSRASQKALAPRLACHGQAAAAPRRGLLALALALACLLLSAALASEELGWAAHLYRVPAIAQEWRTLAEHLPGRVQSVPDPLRGAEVLLLQAALARHRAIGAEPPQRDELLERALRLYEEALQGGAAEPLRALALEQLASCVYLRAESLLGLVEGAAEPADARRSRAAPLLGRLADWRFKEAAAVAPRFKAEFKRYQEWFEKNPERETAPAELLAPVQAVAEVYLPRDKAYLLARLRQVEALAEGRDRSALARQAADYCHQQLNSPDLGQIPGVAIWYGFVKGRFQQLGGEDESAAATWREVLRIPLERLPAEVRGNCLEIRKLLYHDFVKMRMRSASREAGHYLEVRTLVRGMLEDPSLPGCADQPLGKELVLDLAQALTCGPELDPEDFETAVFELRRIWDQGPPWSNNAARMMAQVLTRALALGFDPPLSAGDWFAAGRGAFLVAQAAYQAALDAQKGPDQAQAAAQQAEAQRQYQCSLEFNRRAIALSRAGSGPAARLALEPEAWFDMGLAYLKLKRYAESMLAYRALLEAYGPEGRKQWLPDPAADPAGFWQDGRVQKTLAYLDRVDPKVPAQDGLLHRAAHNLALATKLCPQSSPSPEPGAAVPRVPQTDLEGLADQAYLAARKILEESHELRDSADRLSKEGKAAEALRSQAQALAGYQRAAEAFAGVPPGSEACELALYQAALAYAMAQDLALRMGEEGGVGAARGKELGQRALEGFAQYEEWVGRATDPDPVLKVRRARLAREVLLARAGIWCRLEDWERSLAAAQAGLEAQVPEAPLDEGGRLACAFHLFRAASALAGQRKPPEGDVFLAKADQALGLLKADAAYRGSALRELAGRYQQVAERAQEAGLERRVVEGYLRKAVECQRELLGVLAQPVPGDFARLLRLLQELGARNELVDGAKAMLERLDPQARNQRVEDRVWLELRERLRGLPLDPDPERAKRCLEGHERLLDLLYDTEKGLMVRHAPGLAPEADLLPRDLAKAWEQLALLGRDFPGSPTLRPDPGQAAQWVEGVGILAFVREELAFRRAVLAARELLLVAALDLAEEFGATDPGKAAAYRGLAGVQLEVLEKVLGSVPALRLQAARLKVGAGEYPAAVALLEELKGGLEESAEESVRARILLSKVWLVQGQAERAAEYPGQLVLAKGLDSAWVRRFWPQVGEFLEECYRKGAPRPAGPAPAGEAPQSVLTGAPDGRD